jgi:DNA-binding transcriptional regulator YdaS (Cro superfamily)
MAKKMNTDKLLATKKRAPIIGRIRAERGLMSRIAEGLNVRLTAVSKWHRIPAERIVEVERITGIPREELRPDLYRKKAT